MTVRGERTPDRTAIADRLVIGVGAASLLMGVQLAGLLVALRFRDVGPSDTHRVWLLATTLLVAGYVVASSGTLVSRSLVANLRRPAPEVVAGWIAASLGMIGLAPWVAAEAGGTGRTLRATVVLAQVAVIALCVAWSRSGDNHAVRRRPGLAANVVIATLVATSLMTAGLRFPDVYPLAPYIMYSDPRVGVYSVDRVVLTGIDTDGDQHPLPRPASRQVLLELAGAGDIDRLDALAIQAASGRAATETVLVVRETVQIAPHTADDPIEIVDRQEIHRADLRDPR